MGLHSLLNHKQAGNESQKEKQGKGNVDQEDEDDDEEDDGNAAGAQLASIFNRPKPTTAIKPADDPATLSSHLQAFEGKDFVLLTFIQSFFSWYAYFTGPQGHTRLIAPPPSAHRSPIWVYGVRVEEDAWVKQGDDWVKGTKRVKHKHKHKA